MNDALIVSALSAVPKNHAARWMGRATRLRLPRALHRALVRWFIRTYKVNLDEAQGGVDDYATLAQFFVRPLRPGARPIDSDPAVVTSPVDALVHTIGRVQDGQFAQTPQRASSVAQLLGPGGGDLFDASRFEGGSFAVLYLSPQDYHRVHTAREGDLLGWRYIPGTLWPVFAAATRKVDALFARNERLVFRFDTDLGAIAQVMVGAFGVGRMTSTQAPVTTNTTLHPEEQRLSPAVHLDRGQELGRFELGSTVILFFEPDRVAWIVSPGTPVRLGQPIARVL